MNEMNFVLLQATTMDTMARATLAPAVALEEVVSMLPRAPSTMLLAGQWMTGVVCRRSRTSSLLAAVWASTPTIESCVGFRKYIDDSNM